MGCEGGGFGQQRLFGEVGKLRTSAVHRTFSAGLLCTLIHIEYDFPFRARIRGKIARLYP
jgi:hypothetical protein